MPVYNPGPWNHPNAIGPNNCYNYAIDRLDNVQRNPGDLSRQGLLPIHWSLGCVVGMCAVSDGLVPIPLPTPLAWQTNDQWVAALVTAPPHVGRPYGDYHWLRRDDITGLWSHKTGGGAPATDLDDRNNPIANPRIADLSEYVHFIGYFAVFRARIRP